MVRTIVDALVALTFVASAVVSLTPCRAWPVAWRFVTYMILVVQWVQAMWATVIINTFDGNDVVDIVVGVAADRGDQAATTAVTSSTDASGVEGLSACQMPFRHGELLSPEVANAFSATTATNVVDCALSLRLHVSYCDTLQSHYSQGVYEIAYLWVNTTLLSLGLQFLAWIYRTPFRRFVLYAFAPIYVATLFMAALYGGLDHFAAEFPAVTMAKT